MGNNSSPLPYCLKVCCPRLSTCPQLMPVFNPMYIPELLDLSCHSSRWHIPHNLKFISYQGCWMNMIWCIKDEYWKAGGWLFSDFLVLKKGDLWRFFWRICDQTTLSLKKTPDTPDTDNTSDSDTDTPFSIFTYLSSFSGSEISWFDNWHFLNRHCYLLIASLVSEQISREIETHFDKRALIDERSVNFLFCWLPQNL